MYHIKTRDFYEDLRKNANLMDRLDTSDLPPNHSCYTTIRKKVPGFFSDETNGLIMSEFCALRAKSYSYILEGKEKIKTKGIRGHVVKNHMSFIAHKKCLFDDIELDKYTENVSIRSFRYKLMTIQTKKLSYNNFDDKRVILKDKIHTLAHGHYALDE